MSRPAISVIVPFHNAVATLGDAIESLAASSCREIEVLAVDDASTDGGGEIVRGFAARDARFRCLRNPANRGVSFSRNRGLDEAAGDRLAFVDADDRVSPDWLAHLLADARESGAEVVIGRSRRVCGGTESVYRMEGLRRRGSLDFRQIVFKDNSVVWNKLYAASLIRRLRLRFDESLSIGEDLLFNFQALHAARGIFYGGRGSYLHRADNPSSLMRGTDPAGRVAQYAPAGASGCRGPCRRPAEAPRPAQSGPRPADGPLPFRHSPPGSRHPGVDPRPVGNPSVSRPRQRVPQESAPPPGRPPPHAGLRHLSSAADFFCLFAFTMVVITSIVWML